MPCDWARARGCSGLQDRPLRVPLHFPVHSHNELVFEKKLFHFSLNRPPLAWPPLIFKGCNCILGSLPEWGYRPIQYSKMLHPTILGLGRGAPLIFFFMREMNKGLVNWVSPTVYKGFSLY